jgi:VWFA-related protein
MRAGLPYRKWRRHSQAWVILAAVGMWTAEARAQDSGAAAGNPAGLEGKKSDTPSTQDGKPTNDKKESKSELSSRDTGTTFKLRVNLVQVRVVVRDKQGKLVEGLKKEDFQLYDNGKPQAITTFGVDTLETRRERAELVAKTQQAKEEGQPLEAKVTMPQRFLALVVDDIHLKMEDAATLRLAVKKLIESISPTDRLGIYGTSEQIKVEFTDDKEALGQVLNSVVPRPKMGSMTGAANCPDINHYMADQYLNKSNQQILPVVAQEVLNCQMGGDPKELPAATQLAASYLQQELNAGDTDNDFTYRALEDVLRRLGGMPGERVMILAGPGFLLSTQYLQETGVIDRANKGNIVINTVDARGLYAPDVAGDISQRNSDTSQTAAYKTMYRTAEQSESSYVMMDIAYGTGGTFFHNSNDLEGGLMRLGMAPEVCYVLGFSPPGEKWDGKYHSIKVAFSGKQKYEIQARKGYYAPRKTQDPQEQAKQEIAEAVFSQDEIRELSVDLQTQYFKTQSEDAKLSVVSKIDLKGMHFRKENGRNWNNLTVATVIFDENGNYVTGGEKILEMRLLDTTYDRLSHTGLTMKSSFDVKPGKYMVRQVIRDSEGAQMAARNGAVVIPY